MSIKRIAAVVGIILVAGAGWYLASPLFFDTVVDEQLPVSTSGMTTEDEQKLAEIESLTPEQVQAMPESERMEKKQMMDELGQVMPERVIKEPMEPEPTMELNGTFKDGDSFHRGSGKATIYSLPDGKRLLRFEDFAVTNGPALNVYLVSSADGNVDSGFFDLGKLKGNKGNQNYEIPADLDLSEYKSIVIWCVTFGVEFATASLQ